MSTEEPRVHTLDNGIIVTITPKYSNMSTLVLSGTWQKFLHIGHARTDDVTVHEAAGPFGFNSYGQLDEDWTTFTCSIFHREIDRDLLRLSTLEMVTPYYES
jgi:hypothetical protein